MSTSINNQQRDRPRDILMPQQSQINASTIDMLTMLPLELRQEIYDHHLVNLNQEIATQARAYNTHDSPAFTTPCINDWVFDHFQLSEATAAPNSTASSRLCGHTLEPLRRHQLESYYPIQVWHHEIKPLDLTRLKILELETHVTAALSSTSLSGSWTDIFAREAQAYYFRHRLAVVYETLPEFVAWLSVSQYVRKDLRKIDIAARCLYESARPSAATWFVATTLQLRIVGNGESLELRSKWAPENPNQFDAWRFAVSFFGRMAKRARKSFFDGSDLLKILQYMARKVEQRCGFQRFSFESKQADAASEKLPLQVSAEQMKDSGGPEGHKAFKYVVCSYSL